MPTLWAHGLYFNNASTVVAVLSADTVKGYPAWQSSVIAPSLFGALQEWWERIAWWCRLFLAVWRVPVYLRGELDGKVGALLGPVAIVAGYQAQLLPARSLWRRLVTPRLKRTTAAPVPVPELLTRTATLLAHPAFPAAQAAVRRTARTLGFNRPEAWQGLSRQMKASPGAAENVYRHMQACVWTREAASSTLTNPACNLLVELAYHEFAARGE